MGWQQSDYTISEIKGFSSERTHIQRLPSWHEMLGRGWFGWMAAASALIVKIREKDVKNQDKMIGVEASILIAPSQDISGSL